ncbi:GNAT family N-acetyltransferase [Solibacillus sp. FSL H8-0538]|uniref:GNAT family N-acetyltransferase n=1 Tax=Solibacillus sp. FSL H8-0538 TaxID=2921400 RepID=UPI0030F71406
MNFSIITVSFPIDEETHAEINTLCREAATTDGSCYNIVLNLPFAKSYETKGFYVLAYDDDKDQLVGAASAVDIMGLNTYEWSILVAPMYRQLGIGDVLLNVLREGMEVRGAEGELALAVEGKTYAREFLERRGYMYSFSEATLEAKAEVMTPRMDLEIRPFQSKDTEELVDIFSEAFGDMRDESLDLITYNTTTAGLILWVAELDGKVVGSVTSRKEGEVQWVTALAVHPKFEGRGIGSGLLMWIKDVALRGGEKTILLDVEVENDRALAVYEKAGFMKSSQIDYFVYVG